MAAYPTVPLREVCESIEYGYTASSTSERVGPRFLRITDIAQERLDWDSVPFCEIEPKKLAKHRLRTGDIVIARTGATTGWAKFIKDPPDAVFASYLVRIHPAASVDARFVGFVVESQVYKDFIQQHMGGAAQPNANAQVLTSYEIPCPPLPVQRRIVGILSAYDELMENSQRRIRLLEAMARALYREWFVHFRIPTEVLAQAGASPIKLVPSALGHIPKGWGVKKLGEVANITMGLSPKGNTYNEDGDGTPLINGPVEFGERFTKQVKWTIAPTKFCKEGDLVVCVRGSTTGKYVKSDGVYCLGRGVCGLSSKYQCFVDQLFENELPTLLGQTSGSTFPSWTGPQLKNHPVLSPPPALLARFETLVKPMSAAVLGCSRKIQNLRQTRDLLLPRLLSGQLNLREN